VTRVWDSVQSLIAEIDTRGDYQPSYLVLSPREYEAYRAAEARWEHDWSRPVRVTRFTVAADWQPCTVCGGYTRARHHGQAVHLICDGTGASSD
jgi:hypothetical protein